MLKKLPLPRLKLIPAGQFKMGDVMQDLKEYEWDERPVHDVSLDTYHIGVFEVTNEEYNHYLVSQMPSRLHQKIDSQINFEQLKTKKQYSHILDSLLSNKHPAEDITWHDAIDYCNWLSKQHGFQPVYQRNGDEVTAEWRADGYRLPSEAEWEYAARGGGKKVRFGNGKDIADPKEISFDAPDYIPKPYAITGSRRYSSVPVGSLNSPNDLGLHDMSGNVEEWCWDIYESYPEYPVTQPIGPDKGPGRVMRGGSYDSFASSCRVANRFGMSPDSKAGLRLARSVN